MLRRVPTAPRAAAELRDAAEITLNLMRIHLVVGFVEHYFAQEPRRFLSGELKGPPPKRSLSGARDLLDVRFFLASRCRVSHLMIMYPNTQSSIRESFLFQRLNG